MTQKTDQVETNGEYEHENVNCEQKGRRENFHPGRSPTENENHGTHELGVPMRHHICHMACLQPVPTFAQWQKTKRSMQQYENRGSISIENAHTW